jgi:hypothetical protein
MVRKALTIAAGLAVVASVASAGVPDPRFCTFDAIGTGDNTGTAYGGSPAGFDVSVRDITNAPVPGATVTLNFSASGVKGYAVQNAGTTVNAGAQTLSRVAAAGTTNFAARTGKFNNANSVEVSANGVVLGNVKWRSTDVDGSGGVTGLTDLTYVANRYLGAQTAAEANLDQSVSDVVALGDLTIEANEYLAAASGAYAW